jgi:hypothetical protein
MKKLFQKIGVITAGALIALGFMFTPHVATAADCDGNAVIYCGITSISNLNYKLAHGTGKTNQSAKELTDLFGMYGYNAGNTEIRIVEGSVTKTNKVYAGSKLVASDVYSMGRHKTTGSWHVPNISYPLYFRHPQYSFNSSSIPAYIVYNYDGSFRMAIIKSCGNIVPGRIVHKPKPPVVVPKYNLNILKFNDLNHNGVKEVNEPVLPNWTFTVRGGAVNGTYVTNSNGVITVSNLPAASYTVSEIMQPDWVASTPQTQVAQITNADISLRFGNYKEEIPREHARIRVIKYNDQNGDKVENNGEVRLAGWQFKVTGPNGFSATVVTDANGESIIDNLPVGEYTVTEVAQEGWVGTTVSTLTHEVTLDPQTQDFVFGNRKLVPGCEEDSTRPECIVTPPTTPSTPEAPLASTGPTEVAGMIFGSLAAAGGSLSYIRSRKNLNKALRKR